jgi:hypothetical protein
MVTPAETSKFPAACQQPRLKLVRALTSMQFTLVFMPKCHPRPGRFLMGYLSYQA